MKEGIKIRVDEEVIKLKGSIEGIITSISPSKDGKEWEITIFKDSDDDDFDELERIDNELIELYQDPKELFSICPDPELGYDRSFEAELSRLEDKIDQLEYLIDQREAR